MLCGEMTHPDPNTVLTCALPPEPHVLHLPLGDTHEVAAKRPAVAE
jgi:hypothetical protein